MKRRNSFSRNHRGTSSLLPPRRLKPPRRRRRPAAPLPLPPLRTHTRLRSPSPRLRPPFAVNSTRNTNPHHHRGNLPPPLLHHFLPLRLLPPPYRVTTMFSCRR